MIVSLHEKLQPGFAHKVFAESSSVSSRAGEASKRRSAVEGSPADERIAFS
jgi:hypothetical protein